MSKSLIRADLEARLKAWADSKTPKVPIAYESVNFTKPNSGLFVEVFLNPTDTFNRDVAATGVTEIGLFQINVWGPKGNGAQAIEAAVNEISALYPVVPKGTVSIEKPAHAGRLASDNSGWNFVPVLISYRYES